MKILQINNFHYVKGGADRVYFNTIKLLEDNGHVVQRFSSQNIENTDTKYSKYFVGIHDNRNSTLLRKTFVVYSYLYNRQVQKKLIKLINEHSPDIAHLHLFYGVLTSSVLVTLQKLKIPVLMTVHDYRLLCPANAFLNKNNEICEKCMNRSYYQCSVNRCLEGNVFFSSILTMEAYFRKYKYQPLKYINHFIFVSKFSKKKHIEFNRDFENHSTHLYNFTSIGESKVAYPNEKYFFFLADYRKRKV